MIGLNDPTQILDLLKLIIEGRTEDSLKKLNELYDHGADPILLLKDLITNIHQIGMIKIGANEDHNIGRDVEQTNPYYDGYMAEFVYIDTLNCSKSHVENQILDLLKD